jgi:class 3 adenylate cyclase
MNDIPSGLEQDLDALISYLSRYLQHLATTQPEAASLSLCLCTDEPSVRLNRHLVEKVIDILGAIKDGSNAGPAFELLDQFFTRLQRRAHERLGARRLEELTSWIEKRERELSNAGEHRRLNHARALLGEARDAFEAWQSGKEPVRGWGNFENICSKVQRTATLERPVDRSRRLSAILYADLAGFSRHTHENPKSTPKRLGNYRELIRSEVERIGGRVVDSPGDSFLLELRSATDAVECGVTIQRMVEEREAARRGRGGRFQFRMGVHLGDVEVDGERISGDGVNIAARLQAEASPGGIVISATVYDQVRNRVRSRFRDLGKLELKNVPEPVRAYAVVYEPSGDDGTSPTESRGKRPSTGRTRRTVRGSRDATNARIGKRERRPRGSARRPD